MNHRLTPLIALAAVAFPISAHAQDTEWNRYTLEALEGVFVRAEAGTACEGAGVSAGTVLAAAERTLAEAEVPVLTKAQMLEAPGLPELRIRIDCVTEGGATGFSVSLRVQQAAQMIRDTQITLPEAVTWFTEAVGVASGDETRAAVEGVLGSTLDTFTTAFQAANAVEAAAAN